MCAFMCLVLTLSFLLLQVIYSLKRRRITGLGMVTPKLAYDYDARIKFGSNSKRAILTMQRICCESALGWVSSTAACKHETMGSIFSTTVSLTEFVLFH